MNDLISRSALLEKVQYRMNPESYDATVIAGCVKITRQIIENAPAVDAVEVGSCDGCYWKEIGRHQKCACCRRNRFLKDCYERRADDGRSKAD